jgi:hypothetical protein
MESPLQVNSWMAKILDQVTITMFTFKHPDSLAGGLIEKTICDLEFFMSYSFSA